jgi:hypothetical protein
MIFRLMHGGVRENLALTPVIDEWKLRGMSRPLIVETTMPELFKGNPAVDGFNGVQREACIDFDILEEPSIGMHPIDMYALATFGDNRLTSRRMRVFSLPRHKTVPDTVYVGQRFAQEYDEIYDGIMHRFLKVAVTGYCDAQIGDVTACLEDAKLFIGMDEDVTWLAMTTSVPIVMHIGNRMPETCRPSREGAPFESVTGKCEFRDTCIKNSSSGFGNVYRVMCRKPEQVCQTITYDEVMAAIDRALA